MSYRHIQIPGSGVDAGLVTCDFTCQMEGATKHSTSGFGHTMTERH